MKSALPRGLAFGLSLAVTLGAGGLAHGGDGAGLEASRDYRARHGATILADFAALLRLPNTPDDPGNARENARAIGELLAARGAEVEIWELEGAAPVVYGRLESPGARRRLGLYAHYDGQPVDAAKWTQPPFQPTLYDAAIESGGRPRAWPPTDEAIDPEWRLYARSSGDDKAPIAAWLAALDALAAAGIDRSADVTFLLEGEEERGSPGLGRYFAKYRDRLDVDLWLICDGPVHQSRRPQLVFGVRGITGLELTVYGAERYLHSGHYGNWAPNPAMMLARLLASMKDDDGRVLIPGFYDSVEPLDAASRAAVAAVPAIDDALRAEIGLAATEAGSAPLSERLLLPSLNVRGLASASVGPTARNVIPTRAEASLDVRLVSGNDPETMLDLVEAHVRAQGYYIVRDEPDHATRLEHPRIARIDREPGYRAVRTPLDLPVVRPVIDAARRVSGDEVILLPSLGGSLPLYLFEDRLGRPLVVVPIANHDDNQHGPDENLRVANLWYGIDLFAELLSMP